MSEKTKFHTFESRTILLKDLLPILRGGSYSNYDQSATDVELRPECEDWTHVTFNLNSCFLDLLGDLLVESVEADDGNLVIWIKTDEYNWFNVYGFQDDEQCNETEAE